MKRLMLGAVLLAAFASQVEAQEGDVAAGAAYAKQVCAACHAVLPNEQISPLAQAPTFQKVANTARHDRDGAFGLAAKLPPDHAQHHFEARRPPQRRRLYRQPQEQGLRIEPSGLVEEFAVNPSTRAAS